MAKKPKTKLEQFIGKVYYDPQIQTIWGVSKKDGHQMLMQVRAWGAIQNLFDEEPDAMDFQDEMGQFFADAVNEKIEQERRKS